MKRLLSPDFWVGIASILAIVGIGLAVSGIVFNFDAMRKIGLFLMAPVVVGGIVLMALVFPILIVANRKENDS